MSADKRGLPAAEARAVQDEFNRNSEKLRLVAILSPTCPQCKFGQSVVGAVLRKFAADRLEAIVIWLPMRDADNARSALRQSRAIRDTRIYQRWDGVRRIGKLFAKTLGLRGIAWDVYLLYAPGTKWEGEVPPAPTFWMHQLTAETGAPPAICLNPTKLNAEVARLLRQLN